MERERVNGVDVLHVAAELQQRVDEVLQELLTLERYAGERGIALVTVRRQIERGLLPVVRVGRSDVRVPKIALALELEGR